MNTLQSPALLHIQNLGFAHPGAPVFTGFSAQLPAGVTWIGGDEGTGKSTLLRLLAGELQPAQGQILLDGRPLQSQDVAWFDPLQSAFNDLIARDLLAEWTGQTSEALGELVQGLSLEPHLSKPLYQLSTGSRRKVFLIATLAQQARVTLVDQPFMALDRPSIEFLQRRFSEWTAPAQRLLLIADYVAPEGVPLASTLDLDGKP